MIRTVSLWIRTKGKFAQPLYTNSKRIQLKAQDGEYYLRCTGKWEAVGTDQWKYRNLVKTSTAGT